MRRVGLLTAVLCVLLLSILPVCYNGGDYWWLPAAAIAWTLAFIGRCLCRWWFGGEDRHHAPPVARFAWHWDYLLFLIPALLLLVQLFPSDALVKVLSPHAWECWHKAQTPARLTLHPDGTWENLLALLLAFGIYLLLRDNCRHSVHIRFVLWAITLAALGNAILGIVQVFLLPPGHAFNSGVVTGAFLNRNHFGFLLNLGVCSTAALVFAELHRHSDELRRTVVASNLVPLHHAHSGRMMMLFLILFLLIAGVILSLSRGAFLACVLNLALLLLCWFGRRHHDHHHPHRHRQFLAALIITGAALAFALPFALQLLSTRFDTLLRQDSIDSDTRAVVWRSTLRLIRAYPLAGVGSGAYVDAIQPYAHPSLKEGLIDHAHNDWLELAAELGLPASLALLALFLVCAIPALRRIWNHDSPLRRWTGIAAAIALLGSILHESFDFNLQAFPIAFTLAAWLAILFACGAPEDTAARTTAHRSERRASILLAAFAALLLPCAILWLRGELTHSALAQALQPDYHPQGQSAVQPSVLKALADTASRRLPASNDVRECRARALARYADSLADQAQADACRAESLALRRDVARHRPADAISWLRLARAQTRAVLATQPVQREAIQQCLDLYARALALAPTLRSIQRQAADAALQAWLAAPITTDPEWRRYSENWRRLAIDAYRKMLLDSPEQLAKLLPQLLTLAEYPQDVLREFPESVPLYPRLLALLLQQLRLPEAIRLLADIPEAFWRSTPERHAEYLRWQCQLQLLATGQRSPDLHRQWRDAQRQTLQETAAAIEGLWRQQGAETWEQRWKARSLLPPGIVPVMRLDAARHAIERGRIPLAVHLLLPFAFDTPFPPQTEHLRDAAAILAPLAPPAEPLPALQHAFLKAALLIQLAENGDTAARQQLSAAEAALLQQQRDLAGRKVPTGWLQNHLLPHYLGRLAELRQQPQKAIDHYRSTLRICRTHAPSLRRLAEIAPDTLSAEERAFAEIAAQPPLAYYNDATALLALTATPAALASREAPVSFTVHLLSLAETTQDRVFTLELATARRPFLRHPLPPHPGRPIPFTWRNGEILQFRFEIPMPLIRILQNGQPILPGPIACRLREKHVPAPIPASVTIPLQITEQPTALPPSQP